jgi:outer membrane lipoprotein-sorting protein
MVEVGKIIALLGLGAMISLPSHSSAQTAPPPGGAASAAASSADLHKVISQLDTAAAKFLSAQADFTWDQYQAVVQESDVQSGTIYFERTKGVTRMAAYLQKDNGKTALKTVVYDGGEVDFYEPEIKQMTVLRAGANRGQWESFLTLGFGGSGADLEANWKVSLLGTETMSGVSVAKLDLVPTAQKVQEMFTHVTIWIDPTRGISLKQVFYQPSGDLRTATYKNIRYNAPITGDAFHIKTAPGTTTQMK